MHKLSDSYVLHNYLASTESIRFVFTKCTCLKRGQGRFLCTLQTVRRSLKHIPIQTITENVPIIFARDNHDKYMKRMFARNKYLKLMGYL